MAGRGRHLSIDESSLHDDLFTIVTNKDGHGRTGTVVAMVRGTKAEDVIKVLSNGDTLIELLTRSKHALTQTHDKWSERQQARMRLLFQMYPKLKELYDIVNKIRAIFRSKKLTRDEAKIKLHEWYQAVSDCTIREIKSARSSVNQHISHVLLAVSRFLAVFCSSKITLFSSSSVD